MAKRIDENQPQIVDELRQIGATVQHLHAVGSGCPDIIVGFRGCNFLFEIKNKDKPPSKQRLTPDESLWHREWQGQVDIILDTEDALRIIEEQTT